MCSIKAFFRDGVFENGYVWVFDNRIQAICRISVDDFELKVVCCYKGVRAFIAQRIFLFQGLFYLMERNSTRVLIYDRKEEGKNDGFYLQESLICNRQEEYVVFLNEGSIYFLPRSIDGEVIIFDTSTREYLKKELFEIPIKEKIEKQDQFIQYSNHYEGTVWFTLNNTNFYGRYNLAEGKAELLQAENSDITLSGCCFDGEQVWLTESKSNNVICAGKRIISIPEKALGPCPFLYSVDKGIIIVSGGNNDKLVFIEKGTFRISIVEFPSSEKERRLASIRREYEENDDFVFLFQIRDRKMFIFDKNILKITQVNLKSDNYIKTCFEIGNGVLYEDESINIKYLIRFSGRDTVFEQRYKKEKTEIGKVVWAAIG